MEETTRTTKIQCTIALDPMDYCIGLELSPWFCTYITAGSVDLWHTIERTTLS